MATRIQTYDTTLRDGSQGEGVNFSLQDKLLIAKKLDELGFDYIEGGYPLSNPKDEEFFQRAADTDWKHAKVTAFGMTRRRGIGAEEDTGMCALRDSKAPVITVVGKTWDLHVNEVLRVDEEENLAMIRDSVAFLVAEGREVIYDAETQTADGFRKRSLTQLIYCVEKSQSRSGFIVTTTATWLWPIRWRRWIEEPFRFRGRSTESANDAETFAC